MLSRTHGEVKCAVRAWRTRVRNFQEHMPCVCRWARGDDSVRLPGAVRSPPAWQRFGVTASVLVLVLPPATGECLSFWTLVNLQLAACCRTGGGGGKKGKVSEDVEARVRGHFSPPPTCSMSTTSTTPQ